MKEPGSDAVEQLRSLLDVQDADVDTTALSLHVFQHRHASCLREYLDSLGPKHPRAGLIQFLLVQLNTWLADSQAVRSALRSIFTVDPEVHPEMVEVAIRELLNEPSVEIISTYCGLPHGAKQSLGFYRHTATWGGHERTFLTKYSNAAAMGQEPFFYFSVRPLFKGLQRISPDPVLFKKSTRLDLCLLTMELCEGSVPEISSMGRDRLLDLVSSYQALSEPDLAVLLPHFKDRRTEIAFNHGYLARSMHLIHEKESFAKLMAWIVDAVSSRGYKKEVVEAVRSIAKTLLHHRFNTMVQPSLHYAFLHGDLHRFNVLSSTHGPVFIDWARCTIGPKQIDLATLLRRHGFRGTTELLQEIGVWQQFDHTNKVLFALAMVVVSLMIDIPEIKSEPPDHLFIPAAACIEELLEADNALS